jgi:hypothetical protein
MSGVERLELEDCHHPRGQLSNFREPSIGDAMSTDGRGLSLEATCGECGSTVLVSAHISEVMNLE